MPLNIDVRLNAHLLEHFRISRLEELEGHDREYRYIVQAGRESAEFTHRYSDGARVCLQRALEALGPGPAWPHRPAGTQPTR